MLSHFPLDGSTVETVDAVSSDTATYLELIEGDDLAVAVQEQFGFPIVSGLMILDRAYVRPAFAQAKHWSIGRCASRS